MKFRNFRSYRGPNDGEGNDLSNMPERSGGAVGTGNNARVAMLEAINDRVDEERADQLADVNDDETTSEFVPGLDAGTKKELQRFAKEANQRAGDEDGEDSSESGEDSGAAADAVDTGEPAAAAAAALPKLFKVRIAGVDRELTEEQLIERASKVESADVYLAEAARIRREAQNTQAQPSKDAVPNVDTKERLRAHVRAIQMGTEEEAIEAFSNAVKDFIPSAPSADELLRTVDERLDFRTAVRKFQSEYDDVMSVPLFRDHVLRKDEQLMAAGDKRDPYSRWAALGEEVRAFRDGLKGPAASALAPAPSVDKQNRKAAATPAPKPAGVRAGAPVQAEDREESTSEIIANMAKTRGGPQWARA